MVIAARSVVLFLLLAVTFPAAWAFLGPRLPPLPRPVAALVAATLLSAAVDPAQAAKPDGAALFKQSCSFCHAGGITIMAPSKSLSLADLKSNEAATVDQVVALLKSGRGMMPAFKIPQAELEAVAEFVVSTAQSGSWGSK